jgi:hypothetical protein
MEIPAAFLMITNMTRSLCFEVSKAKYSQWSSSSVDHKTGHMVVQMKGVSVNLVKSPAMMKYLGQRSQQATKM